MPSGLTSWETITSGGEIRHSRVRIGFDIDMRWSGKNFGRNDVMFAVNVRVWMCGACKWKGVDDYG